MAHTNAKNEFTLGIDALSYGPYGIGRLDGQVIMVPWTAPGDKLRARLGASKGRYALGETVRLLEPSPQRQLAPCKYFNECGGCSWQHVRYEAQLQAKRQSVYDSLTRIGKLAGFELRPIIASAGEYHYRRRIRLQCDTQRRTGFFRALSHDLVEIDGCLIAEKQLNDMLEPLRCWVRDLGAGVEYVEIVTGDEADQIVAVAKVTAALAAQDHGACERLLDDPAGIKGLIVRGRSWRRTWGDPAISIVTEPGVCLQLDADAFTQPNSEGNRRMVAEVVAAGEFAPDDRVLELYSGAGNFTLSIAKRAGEVVAVEGNRLSVESGKQSAPLNGLHNIRWLVADARAALARLKRETFSKIVLDPPRAGAKGIDGDLARLGANKILYVSCNPATLARDLAALARRGYQLDTVQPIDLFPHTFHVETLAVMTK